MELLLRSMDLKGCRLSQKLWKSPPFPRNDGGYINPVTRVVYFQTSHDLLSDVPGRCFSEQVGLSSQCSLQPLMLKAQKKQMFSKQIVIRGPGDQLSTPVLYA